ncbi:MAG: ABC transporter permease [Candidatus Aminicenantes bacterium]|nr:ABC transporter permease [Candidatus Aminicenantes bacterium]
MLKNYLHVTFRNIYRNKGYSFIIIFGLALSLSLSLLITQMIYNFTRFDRFHENKDRIYRLVTTRTGENRTEDFATAPFPMASALTDAVPGIEASTVWMWGLGGNAIGRGKVFPLRTSFAGEDFFRLFSYRLKHGDPTVALVQPNSIVLTSKIAFLFFGEDNPVGEVLQFGKWGDYTVTGVLEDTSRLKTHISLSSIISLSTLLSFEQQGMLTPRSENWTNIESAFVYLMLEPGVSPQRIEDGANRLAAERIRDQKFEYRFWLQPLTGIVPGPDLRNSAGESIPPAVIYVLLAVALLVVLSAAFNYTNLSTAQALSRAREVGIRKVIGARRYQIFLQFIGESVTMALLAFLLAFVLYRAILIPLFFSLHDVLRTYFYFEENWTTLGYFLLFAVGTGITAGIIPAIHISRFQPVQAMRNLPGLRVVSRISFRKGLIVFQSALSVVFIISTLIAVDQLNYIRKADPGMRTEGLITVSLEGVDYGIFRQKVVQDARVLGIAGAQWLPGIRSTSSFVLKRSDVPLERRVSMIASDAGFIPVFGLQIVAGSNFPDTAPSSQAALVILNEAAVKEFDFGGPQEAVGRSLLMKDWQEFRVAGVVKDFAHSEITRDQGAFALRFLPGLCRVAVLHVEPARIKDVAANLQQMWGSFESAAPFEYAMFADQIEEELLGMKVMLKSIRFVSILTVIIACLGFLGIADYSSRIRRKEIGIRKVCGAGEWNLIRLLSRNFMGMLAVAAAPAIPLAWWFNGVLLSLYDKRVGMRAELFILGACLVMVLGMGMVLSQTIRAARTDPVDIIRHE